MSHLFPRLRLAASLVALALTALAARAQTVPPPDEAHARYPIGVCGTRHYDPRLEVCDTRNNHLYRFTRIGNQTWMAANLDYGTMIPGGNDQSKPGEKYCLYDKESDCGALYQWAEAVALAPEFGQKIAGLKGKTQGICMAGWHIPSAAEWSEMLALVRKEQGAQNEAVSLMAYSPNDDFRWKSNTTPDEMLPTQDKYGLSVVPSGHRVLKGTCPDGAPSESYFCNAHDMAKFWTSTDDANDPQTAVSITVIEDLPHVVDSSKSIDEFLTPDEEQKWVALAARKATEQSELQRSYKQAQKYQGMSIRCVKD
jgi:uncharacterized protein (TIGR02145 family)